MYRLQIMLKLLVKSNWQLLYDHLFEVDQSRNAISFCPPDDVTRKNKTLDKQRKNMADVVQLCDLPDRFGEHFMPHKSLLRQRIQAKKFCNESFIHTVKLFRGMTEKLM